jgi:hypothetical protein
MTILGAVSLVTFSLDCCSYAVNVHENFFTHRRKPAQPYNGS